MYQQFRISSANTVRGEVVIGAHRRYKIAYRNPVADATWYKRCLLACHPQLARDQSRRCNLTLDTIK